MKINIIHITQFLTDRSREAIKNVLVKHQHTKLKQMVTNTQYWNF